MSRAPITGARMARTQSFAGLSPRVLAFPTRTLRPSEPRFASAIERSSELRYSIATPIPEGRTPAATDYDGRPGIGSARPARQFFRARMAKLRLGLECPFRPAGRGQRAGRGMLLRPDACPGKEAKSWTT
jgi:hypothetical protein